MESRRCTIPLIYRRNTRRSTITFELIEKLKRKILRFDWKVKKEDIEDLQKVTESDSFDSIFRNLKRTILWFIEELQKDDRRFTEEFFDSIGKSKIYDFFNLSKIYKAIDDYLRVNWKIKEEDPLIGKLKKTILRSIEDLQKAIESDSFDSIFRNLKRTILFINLSKDYKRRILWLDWKIEDSQFFRSIEDFIKRRLIGKSKIRILRFIAILRFDWKV